MKSYIIAFLACGLMMASCSDEKATQPTAAFSVDASELSVNQSVTVHFTGNADNVVIFPGDSGQDYELRNENNTGLVVNKGLFTYAYSTPGLYKMVCVATNHADAGLSILTDTCSTWIRVIDDETEITKISAYPVVRDEIFATQSNESDWLMAFPRKMRYQSSNPAVTLSRKLKFYTKSASTKVSVDGVEFSAAKSYDLSKVLNITAESYEGSLREYKLHTLYYGEFKTFNVAGVKGEIERDPFDYNNYVINISAPAGTDIKALKPTFTLFADNEKVYIDDQEQISGESVVDFTNPVTYRFVTTSTVNPEITVESTCVVTINK